MVPLLRDPCRKYQKHSLGRELFEAGRLNPSVTTTSAGHANKKSNREGDAQRGRPRRKANVLRGDP